MTISTTNKEEITKARFEKIKVALGEFKRKVKDAILNLEAPAHFQDQPIIMLPSQDGGEFLFFSLPVYDGHETYI